MDESPVLVVKDIHEAKQVGDFIREEMSLDEFNAKFGDRTSKNFDATKHLERVGVINQTTMLASETQEIADYFRDVMKAKYGEANIKQHFADTRDTLCYATNENQDATYGLLEQDADIAVVVGGYNSSNTSHLVELCERKFPTYFIKDETEILSADLIRHFDLHTHHLKESKNWLPSSSPAKIILTSGASCPDSVVDRVLQKILTYFPNIRSTEQAIAELAQ